MNYNEELQSQVEILKEAQSQAVKMGQFELANTLSITIFNLLTAIEQNR